MTTTGATAAALCMFLLLATAQSEEEGVTIRLLSENEMLTAITMNQLAILKIIEGPNASYKRLNRSVSTRPGGGRWGSDVFLPERERAGEMDGVSTQAITHPINHTPCKAGSDVGMERNVDEEWTKKWLERSLRTLMDEMVEAQQQNLRQVSEEMNSSGKETLTNVQEEMRRELKDIRQAQQQCLNSTTSLFPKTEELEEEPNLSSSSRFLDVVHNDSNPSLCFENRVLVGTVGALTVVSSGNYGPSMQCSWKLVFPRRSTVTMWWEYIDMEHSVNCSKDVVEVRDLSQHSQPVYGRHCGIVPVQNLQQYNVMVHGTTSLLVSFKSDAAGERRGFFLRYHAH